MGSDRLLKVLADDATVWKESGALCLFFDSSETGNYVSLQILLEPTEQDRRLGQEGLYLEVDDQSNGAYNAVASISLVPNRSILLKLTNVGRKALDCVGIEVSLNELESDLVAAIMKLADLAGVEFRTAEKTVQRDA